MVIFELSFSWLCHSSFTTISEHGLQKGQRFMVSIRLLEEHHLAEDVG